MFACPKEKANMGMWYHEKTRSKTGKREKRVLRSQRIQLEISAQCAYSTSDFYIKKMKFRVAIHANRSSCIFKHTHPRAGGGLPERILVS